MKRILVHIAFFLPTICFVSDAFATSLIDSCQSEQSESKTATRVCSFYTSEGFIRGLNWIEQNYEAYFVQSYNKASKRSTHDDDECRFWTSQSAYHIYALVCVSLMTQQTIFLYGVPWVILRDILSICKKWGNYWIEEKETTQALRNVKTWFKVITRESEKAVSGDYKRLLALGYGLHVCTAPGESTIKKILRDKMSIHNKQLINEFDVRVVPKGFDTE